MSPAATYDAEIHPSAVRELEVVPAHEREQLRERLVEMARLEQPSEHRKAKELSGSIGAGLLTVRSGKWRGIVTLDKPALRLLLVEKRKRVYDRLEAAQRRRSA